MEMKQLEAFVAVVQHNSFSKAADMIYLSQPTISAHISSLENEIGAQLLIRSTKAVYPTQTGKELFHRAKNILALRDEAISSVNKVDREMSGEISILASTVPAQFLLPEIITAFQKQYPHIVFHVHQADSLQVVEELLGYRYDFGLVGTSVNSRRLMTVPFYRDTLVLITPKSMIVNKGEMYRDLPAFLRQQPFVMRGDGSGTRVEMEQLLHKQGVSVQNLNVVAYFHDTQSILSAVSHGMGVSFVSQVAAAAYEKIGQIKVYDLEQQAFVRQLHLVFKKEMVLSPVQRLFVTYLENYFTS
ncbi:selenium metabolism-associated LysR family transcriptional regulator [Sporomusa sp. KB1]|jgi:DNA-binding transcriptional LysR family regulator|uniref:selenium metabolism-associated LysR family transcriptional regulator n=1 Tax=Sporomusa sp. KB1 TaxID=943346 RepID=UPI00119FEDB4|nr:selenium metabolism-associated LysR family transcriptional regulator [Sporomusa sp. KB1]TWH47262.1 DNA-binding transcriptional LysR family regulator [Sporomusa sp. KB1]